MIAQLYQDIGRSSQGIDLCLLYAVGELKGSSFGVWYCMLIGYMVSSYFAMKMAYIAEEVCKGGWQDKGLGADECELNLFQ